MTSNTNTLSSNNVSTLTTGISDSALSTFVVYQQTLVEHSFPTLSAPSLIVKRWLWNCFLSDPIFIRLSFHLLQWPRDYPCILFRYQHGFRWKRSGNRCPIYFRSFFNISNLTGVAISDVSGRPIKLPDSDSRPADDTYFTFCSNVSTTTVDCHVPKKSLSLKFPPFTPIS